MRALGIGERLAAPLPWCLNKFKTFAANIAHSLVVLVLLALQLLIQIDFGDIAELFLAILVAEWRGFVLLKVRHFWHYRSPLLLQEYPQAFVK